MKIVIINGSPREKGLTAGVLRRLEKNLTEQGADVEFYDLSTLKMAQCRGCCACYTTGRCSINDDAEMLSHAIENADGLILGTPTYASNVSGYMKLLIDRGHFVIEQLLSQKHCITVTTGENYGSKDASKVLKKLILYSGGYLVRSIVINAPFNSGISRSEEKQIEVSAQKLFRAINKHKRYPFQSLFHGIIFSFGIKPFVKKKGEKYRGVVTKWKEYGV
ncbi:MAG: flavodoxin family protein [Clostridiales bacterium]|nr:flavodoxin family protein [Clostridiales bacterium]